MLFGMCISTTSGQQCVFAPQNSDGSLVSLPCTVHTTHLPRRRSSIIACHEGNGKAWKWKTSNLRGGVGRQGLGPDVRLLLRSAGAAAVGGSTYCAARGGAAAYRRLTHSDASDGASD